MNESPLPISTRRAMAALRFAALAGCTAIEHGTFLDNETLQLMHDRGTFFDPNFLVLHNYLDNRSKFLGIGNYTEEGFQYMEKALPKVSDVLRRARAKGRPTSPTWTSRRTFRTGPGNSPFGCTRRTTMSWRCRTTPAAPIPSGRCPG